MFPQYPNVIPLSSVIGHNNNPFMMQQQMPQFGMQQQIPQFGMHQQIPQFNNMMPMMNPFNNIMKSMYQQPNIPLVFNQKQLTNHSNQQLNEYSNIMEAVTNSNAQIGECVNVNGITYVIRKTGEDGYAIRV